MEEYMRLAFSQNTFLNLIYYFYAMHYYCIDGNQIGLPI